MGLVARKIEAAGIPTVTLNMLWVFQQAIRMPRVAAIEHPFGRPFGDVDDAVTQSAVLQATLAVFERATMPGHVEHLPFGWHEEPKKTKWHPPVAAPIIGHMRKLGKL